MCKKRSSQSPSRLQFSRPVAAGTMSGSRRLQLTPPADTGPCTLTGVNQGQPADTGQFVGRLFFLARHPPRITIGQHPRAHSDEDDQGRFRAAARFDH
jgi:hypothetical protein